MPRVRPPAVAGTFYPATPARLAAEVARMLELAASAVERAGPSPKALVAPHAGYAYSGPIAATAFARVGGAAHRIERVVVLGPAHRLPLRGMVLPEAEVFATPLGEVAVDLASASALERSGRLGRSGAAHASEHSLEVEVPFLQLLIGTRPWTIVPIAVGDAEPSEVAAALEALWGGDETLVVVSSDLSHFLPYEPARELDASTAARIVALDDRPLEHDRACGAAVLSGLMLAARRRTMRAECLELRNSGDTAGTRDRVVGYGAFAFYEQRGAK